MSNRLKLSIAAVAVSAMAYGAMAPAQAKVEGDTITFGVAVSLTGRYAVNGKHTKNGYDLAVKLINEKGGVTVGGKKYKLAVKYYDDESTAARATQLAERLIQQDKIKFVLGPYSSGMTKAVAPVMEKYKIPMVEGNGASRSIFNQGFRYTFAVLSTSEQYLKSAVDLAAEVAKKEGRDLSSVRIAIGVRNDPFSLDIGAGVREDAARYGMKVVIDEKFPKDVTDMTSFLTKVKALKPDVLVVSAHTVGGAVFVRQMNEQKVSAPMVAMTHCESAKVTDTKIFGNASEGILCAGQWSPELAYKDNIFGTAMDYTNTFEKTYGYVPPYQAAESTAAVMVYADAIQRANSFDTEKVRDALASTDMQTFYGNILFAKSGQNIAKPMILRQVQDGKYRLVAPTAWADSELNYPRMTQ
ncbi:MAG: amino acid ABC transporter substrate-binding protein [Alphaproteobacteria bacterium]|nr:amino acid ABC transporter substrate-binding protein [Alphaproteobacteria bacterium]